MNSVYLTKNNPIEMAHICYLNTVKRKKHILAISGRKNDNVYTQKNTCSCTRTHHGPDQDLNLLNINF